jgi:TrpR-related protein YerC/YecD
VREFNSKLKNEELDYLFEAILTLKTVEDCYRFFEDVCTINEINSMSQRMQVAKMLSERKTYIDIADTTGASTATISRVNRCLNYGADGYKIALEKLRENKKKQQEE